MNNILKAITIIGLAIVSVYLYNFYSAQPEPGNPQRTSEKSERDTQSEISSAAQNLVATESKNKPETNRNLVNIPSRETTKPIPHTLPTEETLLSNYGGTFDTEAMNAVLSTDKYNEKFKTLQEEQLSNYHATQLTEAQTDLFENYPEFMADAELELNELSCGLTICMGTVNTFDDGQTWRQFVINYLGGQDASVFGAMSSFPFQLDENTLAHRFIFSVDPEDNVFTATIEDGTVIYAGDPPEDTTPPNDGDSGG